jgi:hypothetical protein
LVYLVGVSRNKPVDLLTDSEHEPGIPTSVRLDPDVRDALEDLARSFEHNISWAVRHTLRVGLRELGLWLPAAEVEAETRRFEESLAAAQGSIHG